jgi:hypothetical protein
MSPPGTYLGKDCYDCNGSAHPGQMTYYPSDRGDGSFDYSCSGGSPEEQNTATSCGSPSGTSCISGYFSPDPGCGMQGTFYTCAYGVTILTPMCSPSAMQMQIQRCR